MQYIEGVLMQVNSLNHEDDGIGEEYFPIAVSDTSITETKSHFSYTWKLNINKEEVSVGNREVSK